MERTKRSSKFCSETSEEKYFLPLLTQHC